MEKEKQQILIVDDEEINRIILKEIFQDEYEVLEAVDGRDAVYKIQSRHNMVLILLDVIMPVMDGFMVLEYMQEHGLIDKIPVILITSESVGESEGKAYSYGVADVMHKPFYPYIVKRRSRNIINLYQHQQHMEERLKEQEEEIRTQEKEIRKSNEFIINALSSVVEFRSAETGEHTRRIKYFTRVLLRYLVNYFPKYGLTPSQVDKIARASALHDIGKVGIPDAILLKPGRLTSEEFEIMKTHTTIGCEMLVKFRKNQTDEFYRCCYDICRYHHERWDGNGYPDHLAGDDIPISAQIVAVADVYDALISPRVYKSAYASNEAFDMILNGECGLFSPDIMECFSYAKEDFFNIVEVINMFSFS